MPTLPNQSSPLSTFLTCQSHELHRTALFLEHLVKMGNKELKGRQAAISSDKYGNGSGKGGSPRGGKPINVIVSEGQL